MDIRFFAHAKEEQSSQDGVADHARRRLQSRLGHCADRVAHVSVRFGDTGSRRGRRDMYCVMQVQLRDAPAASVVDIGADAYDTIDRATDRVGQLVVELICVADGQRSPSVRTKEIAA